MDYNEVLQRARARMAPRCKVCPECNGLGCGNTMPGPGSKAPGNGANDNWHAWRRWCLNMDTIAPNTPVDTSLELLGRTFSLPVIAAPIGSLRAQFNPEDDIRDYNACCIAAAAQTGIAASFGDGLDARVFPHGCTLSQQYGGIGLPVINPLSMDTIRANLDLANAARPFAVSVVIDSAGLPHLKAASPDAGSKTVAELRELCGYAQMPMILKGIMTVRGAEKAVEAGAAAIVVSNHGGRVLPGSAATADVLPEIADAVGDRVKILVDGGIRSGTDIFRALALGADAVMICRPFLISYYGGGTEGIVTYVEKLRAELTDAMYMCGARSLATSRATWCAPCADRRADQAAANLVKKPHSLSPPVRRKKVQSFSSATCAAKKILLGLQTCAPSAQGERRVRCSQAATRFVKKVVLF